MLMPDSTSSHMFSKRSGSGTIVEVRSPYSYIVNVDGGAQVFRVIVRSMLISLAQMSSVIQVTVYFDHMSLFSITEYDCLVSASETIT